MQNIETELKNIGVKGDEESINFRPSPNFKHMKKYSKSKLKEICNDHSSGGELSPMLHSEEPEKVKQNSVMVQPPLPPNTPPPDVLLVPKKEIEDPEYSDHNEKHNSASDNVMEELNKEPESKDKQGSTMCRQWARGVCYRGASCIYVHKIIHSQLPDVYTFCKNFQNNGCFYPKCKFVHATVFEKEHYYRTGKLPPHVFAHLKDTVAVQASPSVPGLEGPAEVPATHNNPAPAKMPGLTPSTLPVVVNGDSVVPDILGTALAASSPLKRAWSEIEDRMYQLRKYLCRLRVK